MPDTKKGPHTTERRTERIELRVTSAELARIRSASELAGMSLTEYIVRSCIGKTDMYDLRRVPGYETRIDRVQKAKRAWAQRKTGKKDRDIHIRCTAPERERIEEKANMVNLPLTDYVILSALDAPIIQIVWQGEDKLKGILKELRRQGANINQLTLKLNRLNSIAWRHDVNPDYVNRALRELAEDNERTRVDINDAIREAARALALLKINQGQRD